MGDVLYHYIVVVGFKEEAVLKAHAQAVKIFSEHVPDPDCVSRSSVLLEVTPVSTLPVNSYFTFVVFPDGSKEGWFDSDVSDRKRDAFVFWLRAPEQEALFLRWAELRLGGWAFGGGALVERSETGDAQEAYCGDPGYSHPAPVSVRGGPIYGGPPDDPPPPIRIPACSECEHGVLLGGPDDCVACIEDLRAMRAEEAAKRRG
jgi:hypothetical protein